MGSEVGSYEWDREKSEENRRKHGLSFDDAPIVLGGPCLTFADTRFEYGEERYITFGFLRGRMVVIAHTPRDETTRIISMRKANSREQRAYQERSEANRSDA
ncbi:MAG: BrnT family toxin [Gemmatimonadota bacterium]|uniref:BrnT family toxin n=1 Tax=Candidatus Palauibacter scopulicola TaxID=3056741 RepID=UPI0022C55787|nr:BrnT family toxin [Candidatus Palauibacter rhopaloidicola]MDE2663390.1 BrnT family toxin [Candidatus Palauibacter scopulicola]